MSDDRQRARPPRARLLTGYPAAIALLALLAWMADTSIGDKCTTFDEIAHLTGGYSYWRTGDYRLYPENGMLPQWWGAWPLHLRGWAFPSLSSPAWTDGNHWQLGDELFYGLGNDPGAMLRAGRRMIIVVGMALGFLVYAWSRRLFGPSGGMVSLALYAFSPSMLAHGRLVTSDVTAACTMTAALWCIWRVLHGVSPGSVLACGVVCGLAFLSKVSALVLLPVAAVLTGVRLFSGEPLRLHLGGERRRRGRAGMLGVIAVAAVVSTALASAVVWGLHGFRFASGPVEPVAFAWDAVLPGTGSLRPWLERARDWHLLPERQLFGVAHVLHVTAGQPAFLRGEFRLTGWWYYYPYCFLVKTPVGTLAVLTAALAALVATWWRTGRALPATLYQAAPLVVLVVVYWTFALTSAYDLGERHLLVTYPAIFVLGGAAAWWRGVGRVLVALLLAALVLESWAVRPHYLAFFNVLAGGPANGYRLLVDSSLDWGQDVPGLARWLAAERARGELGPIYLSYFGMCRPEHYGITAHRLPGSGIDGYEVEERLPLAAGTYCVSATALANIYNKLPAARGPWRPEHDAAFERLRREATRFERTAGHPAARQRLVAERGEPYWHDLLWTFDMLRQARLTAYLRARRPDAQVGHSILIYRLSPSEVHTALHEPLAVSVPGS